MLAVQRGGVWWVNAVGVELALLDAIDQNIGS
jgi:hypothetical protein